MMKAMQCDRAAELIGPYLDQELDAETRRDVAAHLGGCRSCSALAESLRSMSRQLATLGREPAPAQLSERVRSLVAGAADESRVLPRQAARGGSVRQGWLHRTALVLLACGMTAGATALLMSRMQGWAALERDVAAAHVRSLLQDSPMQVVSSDAHTIKPWFAGRLDFAPTVRDLTAEGFPLAGARLDFVGERRVAALVYRRRLHLVNVFVWPSADGIDSAPRGLIHRGYNVVTWSKEGIVYWAVSDLNMTEMRLLQSLL
jgi:anti-sigma factor RsiW